MSKNNKVKVDSPEYNKKSKGKFVIILIVSFAIGGIGGLLGARATDIFKDELTDWGTFIAEKLPYIQVFVVPWILLAMVVVCFILGEIWLKKAKKQIASWDGEDDDHIDIADGYLCNVGNISNILMISIQIIFGFATYQLIGAMRTTDNFYMTFLAVVFYFAGMFVAISQQNRMVKALKEYAPEKKGSIYDTKFQKVWYESCDEAERQKIGDASRQTVQFMNGAFSTTLTIAIILGMFIPIGFLCAFFVGLLWLIISCYYSHVCKKLEQGK